MVGDRYAMGVAAQIMEHCSGPPKGGFALTTQSLRKSGRSQEQRFSAEKGCRSP